MKLPAFTSVLCAALLAPAAAQTIQPELEQRYESGQYAITLGATVDQFAGVDIRTGPGGVWLFDFCADFASGVNDSGFYDVSTGFGSLTSGQEEDIRRLLYNTLPYFSGMLQEAILESGHDWPEPSYVGSSGATYNDLHAYGAGMQLALWEIIHDHGSNDLDSGNFSVGAVPDPDIAIGRANADLFLSGVANGWVYNGGFTFQYAAPVDSGGIPVPNGQDRLWVVIPEPSSALLGTFGLLALLRRRRA